MQNEQRKKWRQQKQKEKSKTNQTIKPNVDKNYKEKRRARYLQSKENLKLKVNIERMTKVIRTQRKTIYRYKKEIENLKLLLNKTENEVLKNKEMEGVVTKEATTPFSKTERFLEEVPSIPTPEKEKVKKAIFENYVLKESLSSQFSKARSRSERDVLKNVINNDIVKKYKLKTNFGYSCLGLKGRLRIQKRPLEIQKIKRIKEIQDFLGRDDNSRTTAGKRETKTFNKDKR